MQTARGIETFRFGHVAPTSGDAMANVAGMIAVREEIREEIRERVEDERGNVTTKSATIAVAREFSKSAIHAFYSVWIAFAVLVAFVVGCILTGN